MIINWNVNNIIVELQKCYYAANDPRMDGFVTWGCKQDLYRVKFAVEEMLAQCSIYHGETEWLEEQRIEREKLRAWTALKKV